MPEYAQPAGRRPSGADSARTSTRPAAQRTSSSANGSPAGVKARPAGQRVDQGATAQAIAQLRRALGRSPRVAHVAQLASLLQHAGTPGAGRSDTVQRLASEEEEPLQGTFAAAQRMEGVEEEEMLQGRFDGGAAESTATAAPNRTGMPDPLKAGVESLSGLDLSDVRVHTNSDRPARLNALAYAQGNDIHLSAGQERHLPHEAWHVVQQRQGRVLPTAQMRGTSINDDQGLEAEAHRMGARASQMPLKER